MGELLTTPSETSARNDVSADGERSRAAILDAAAQLATVEGLDGLSIGRLAEHTGMSKSGLYAHFGSKEELQLATIDAAAGSSSREVIEPARSAEGAARLEALSEAFLSYLARKVFPGRLLLRSRAGGARHASRPGAREATRDRAAAGSPTSSGRCAARRRWASSDADEDPAQLAFEIDAMLKMATAVFVLHDDAEALVARPSWRRSRVARAKIGA